jgi:hypothetical protein
VSVATMPLSAGWKVRKPVTSVSVILGFPVRFALGAKRTRSVQAVTCPYTRNPEVR